MCYCPDGSGFPITVMLEQLKHVLLEKSALKRDLEVRRGESIGVEEGKRGIGVVKGLLQSVVFLWNSYIYIYIRDSFFLSSCLCFRISLPSSS